MRESEGGDLGYGLAVVQVERTDSRSGRVGCIPGPRLRGIGGTLIVL